MYSFKLKTYLSIFSVLMLNVTCAFAQNSSDPFDELGREMASLEKEGSAEELKEFNEWKERYLSEYQDFRQKHFKKLDDIRDKLINTWGETDSQRASLSTYYSPDNQVKTSIDFENDVMSISILHDVKENVTTSKVNDALKSTLSANQALSNDIENRTFEELTKKIANTTPTQKPIEVVAKPDNLFNKEINKIKAQAIASRHQVEKIHDMSLYNASSELVASDNPRLDKSFKAEFMRIEKEKEQRIKALQETQKKASTVKQRELLKSKRVTTYTVPLTHKSFMKKAAPFKGVVNQHSQRWQLPNSILFSVIHTESHFNTKAQSPIPAYGLMQIVPLSAGLDVNRFLHKKNNIMSKQYLFNAENNIETGVAYMHLLNSRYLAKIINKQSRLYCMIAAYNTGAGNVAKTFNYDNSRNITKASTIINSMTPEQVYNKLISDLPYEETRKYLQKVIERQAIYKSMDQI